jgi:phosphatidylserine/phosphatidylglycerophosphate/cardiolipin synthase-like enzyme/uncharacterized membrane protein YdjX (TVP38/TMEM64 family)
MVFALEREPLPTLKLGWRTHRRVHFRLDKQHPVGASHHQKIVVIDDALAFVGGIDLAIRRWDTPAHYPSDPRRVDPRGQPYPPVHDVQMAVDGEAAAALGELVRERWWRATGRRLDVTLQPRNDPWPRSLTPDLENASVAIARTQPAYNGMPEVREVEALYLDAIAAARRSIYIEAQYFTSTVIGNALAQRLAEPAGPEVILVLPREGSGWLEQRTMSVLRARLLRRLRAADHFQRLRVYYPVVPQLGDGCINVHSKLLVVDETLVRIGSANLADRSMGLDTECDLAIEAGGEVRIERAIAHLRNRLLGEHLGVAAESGAGVVNTQAPLIAAVESASGLGRRLEPLHGEVPTWHDRLLPDGKILDPQRPLAPERSIARCIPENDRRIGGRRLMRSAIFLLILVGLAAAWRWSPLGNWLEVATLVEGVEALHDHPLTPLVVIGAYLVGGLLVVPVTMLIMATAVAFGPLLGFTYSLLGCLLSALLTYGIGSLLGGDTVRRLAGTHLSRQSHRITRHGLTAILIVRLLPVAPFSVVNVMAGAWRMRLQDFALGTFLGMLPGIVVMTLFGGQLAEAIRDPNVKSFLILITLVAVIGLVTAWMRRRFMTPDASAATESPPAEGQRARLRCGHSNNKVRCVFGGFL